MSALKRHKLYFKKSQRLFFHNYWKGVDAPSDVSDYFKVKR